MKILELFSGIGGMHYALKESTVQGEIRAAIDINCIANVVYRHNFRKTKLFNKNIAALSAEYIEKLNIDGIFMSPPCQPFTRVGLKKDLSDKRCLALLRILEIIPKIESLKYILLENVVGFETSETRDKVISCLEMNGYQYKELILSPCEFGMPNTRYRYYLLAKKNGKFIFKNNHSISSLPDEILKILPISQQTSEHNFKQTKFANESKFTIDNIIEKEVDPHYFLEGRLLEKRINVMDIRSPECRGSCCFTKSYSRYIEGTGSFFSPLPLTTVKEKLYEFKQTNWDVESNETKFEKLLELKIRYFTPIEVARLMNFPESFEFPKDIKKETQKYRLLGNSLNVLVVSQLIFLLNFEGDI